MMTLSISPLNSYFMQMQVVEPSFDYFADLQGKAIKSNWKNIQPMSSLHEELDVDWRFESRAFKSLCMGSVPQEMGDKWFIYQEGDCIHFHRSWTGLKVWECHFRFLDQSNQWQIYKVIACRDSDQYRWDKCGLGDELATLKTMLPKMS